MHAAAIYRGSGVDTNTNTNACKTEQTAANIKVSAGDSLTENVLIHYPECPTSLKLSSCVIILDSMYIAFKSRDDISVCHQYIVHVGIKWFLSYFIFKLNKLHFSHSD